MQYLRVMRSIGVLGVLRLVLGFLLSTLYFWRLCLIRWPFYTKNKRRILLGSDVRIGPGSVLECINSEANIFLGNGLRANYRLHIGSNHCVRIGDNVLIASDVYISDHSHGAYRGAIQSEPTTLVNKRPLMTSEVQIGDNVWIGDKVCILPGVAIGNNSIIGACSVVTTDIPENSIAVGAPARVIKKWDGRTKTWIRV